MDLNGLAADTQRPLVSRLSFAIDCGFRMPRDLEKLVRDWVEAQDAERKASQYHPAPEDTQRFSMMVVTQERGPSFLESIFGGIWR